VGHPCTILLAEARAYQEALAGPTVRCSARGGWPALLALEVPGHEPAVEYPCPFGNFSGLVIDDELLAGGVDYRDLLTRAVLAR